MARREVGSCDSGPTCPGCVSCAGCVLPSSPSPGRGLSPPRSTLRDTTPHSPTAGMPVARTSPPAADHGPQRRAGASIVPCPGVPCRASEAVYHTPLLPMGRSVGCLPRSPRFSLCMPGPEDPDRPSSILPYRCLCVGVRCVQTVAVCLIAFTRLCQTSGGAVTLPAYSVPGVRFTWFVQSCRSSSPSATRGTGAWLDLTRWGLPPHKKRQASLGARTPGIRCGIGEGFPNQP
jgi:hypothetical protein